MINKFEKLEEMVIDRAPISIVLNEIGRGADMLPDRVDYYKDGKPICHTGNVCVDYVKNTLCLEDHYDINLNNTTVKFDEDIYTQDNKYKRDVKVRFENDDETVDFVWENVGDGSAYVYEE